MPEVSVVMPMRNAEGYLLEAVRSVLDQSFKDFELVIVDDGSTDRSRQMVETIDDSRVRVVEGPGRGVALALNAGIDAACGRIIMRCDADDGYVPGRIDWQVKWLDEHPAFGAVCGSFDAAGTDGLPVSTFDCGEEAQEITEELQAGVIRTHLCCFAVQAELLRQTGGCREYFVLGSDLDLQTRIAEVMRVWYEPRSCYLYRLHQNSITHGVADTRKQFFQDAASRFARQRRQTGDDDLQRGCPPLPPPDTGRISSARQQLLSVLRGKSWRLHGMGQKRQAIVVGWQACRQSLTNFKSWRSLVALVLKKAGTQKGAAHPRDRM